MTSQTQTRYAEAAIEAVPDLPIVRITRDFRATPAQLLRARGIQEHEADNLREALEMFRRFGARPTVARVEVELGQLTDDPALVNSGTALPEALGDLAYLGRVAATAR